MRLPCPLLFRIALVGMLMLACSFGLFQLALAQDRDLATARTIAVNVFVMIEIFYLFNCRSLSRPFWQLGWFSNPWGWVGALTMLVLQLAFTYLPVFHRLFATTAVGAGDWLAIVLCGLSVTLIVGLEKRLRHRAVR